MGLKRKEVNMPSVKQMLVIGVIAVAAVAIAKKVPVVSGLL